ncbi:MAG TPA: hypothetical protein VHL79_24295 [Ramlibacter sp.]|jgi:hypothetical protein|nr:hypothetical protein [Ramlibacter sp.]
MSDAGDRLARNRRAILEHVARKQRRHDPHEETAGQGFAPGSAYPEDDEPPAAGGGWFGHLSHAVRTWWRYHPAQMAVELATPLMRGYARRKPLQLLAISMGVGAALTFARPWKLISVGTLLVALLKSSQLSHLFMAAMSAADYRKDHDRPE